MAVETPQRLAWTVAEVAAMLGLSPSTVRRRIEDGQIPAKQLGRCWRIPKGAFARWMESQGEPDSAIPGAEDAPS